MFAYQVYEIVGVDQIDYITKQFAPHQHLNNAQNIN